MAPNGIGDIALNYRYQLLEEGPGRPAMSPRVSLLIPSGDQSRGLGVSGWGLQFNLPVSKQVGDFYFHGNAGFSWRPNADSDVFPSASLVPAPDVTLFTPFVAGSTIYRLRPMVNLMLESVFAWQDDVVAPGRARASSAACFRQACAAAGTRREADHCRRRAANHLGERHDRRRDPDLLLVRSAVLET